MAVAFSIMQWPLLACLLLPGLLVYLGLHIVRREIIFVDLALAQVAALGTCVGLVAGYDTHDWQTFAFSVVFTMAGAAIFTLTRGVARAQVPQEALIGVVYVVSAALGVLLLSGTAEGNEELRRTLIGDVLLVSPSEVGGTFVLYVVIAAIHCGFRRRFLALSFAPETLSPGQVQGWDFCFYLLFGVVVTSFVQIGGVLLVFSYLIIPALCANLFAERIVALLAIGWGIATTGSVVGLACSFVYDLPTGAAIVCVLGALLLGSLCIARYRFGGEAQPASRHANGGGFGHQLSSKR